MALYENIKADKNKHLRHVRIGVDFAHHLGYLRQDYDHAEEKLRQVIEMSETPRALVLAHIHPTALSYLLNAPRGSKKIQRFRRHGQFIRMLETTAYDFPVPALFGQDFRFLTKIFIRL
ncbi:hypothetical protein BGZ65_007978, partial [Modicella reniformis]